MDITLLFLFIVMPLLKDITIFAERDNKLGKWFHFIYSFALSLNVSAGVWGNEWRMPCSG